MVVVDVKGGQIAANIRQEFGEVAEKITFKRSRKCLTIAEFGFGMNDQARMGGNA